MRLTHKIIPYLSGEAFSNGLKVEFDMDADDHRLISRLEWLERICKNKKIIHGGCVDHSLEQIEHKLARNKWAHSRLAACAARCLGVDKNKSGIDYLSHTLGYRDVACIDLIDGDCGVITATSWDYLVLVEILEHINNPVEFLRSLADRYRKIIKAFIITVPNAFDEGNQRFAKYDVESINSDHRYWFTPYTICKVAHTAGLAINSVRTCQNGVIKRRHPWRNWRLARRPFLRNGIILIAHT